MPIRRIPFGEWLPDLGEFNNEGLYKVRGAVNSSGRWVPGPVNVGTEITGAAAATYAFADIGGFHLHTPTSDGRDLWMYVGVDDDILRSTTANTLVTQRATAAGLANDFDTTSGWQFTSFGNAVYAAMFNAATGNGYFMRASTPSTNFATFVAATNPTTYSPIPRFVSYIKGHLLIAGVEMQTTLGEFTAGTFYPNLLMWSATDGLNDGPTRWGDELTVNYPETVGSSYQMLDDDFGPITGLCGGMDYAYIFKARAIYRMDGPEWQITPVVTGAGTIYPNSIVRFYNDVYFWGPAGPAVLRYGSSEVENIAATKCQRAITSTSNTDFFEFVMEPDAYSDVYPRLTVDISPIAISAAADYRAGLVAFFCYDEIEDVDAGLNYGRSTPVLIYDTATKRFSTLLIPSKFAFARSAPRFGRNPVVPSSVSAIQHSVLDGIHGIGLERATSFFQPVSVSSLTGDVSTPVEITISGAGDYLYDWFPKFTTAFNPLALDDQNGPITTSVKRVRVPFTMQRFDETVVDGYSSADYEWAVKVNVTVRTKNRYSGETEEVTGSWTSSDSYQQSDGWIDLSSGKGSTEGEYHQFEIEIVTLSLDGTKVNGLSVHLRDLTYFEVEYDMGSPCGSTYIA